MEINPQLVEQINNAKAVILSVESEFYAFRRARSNLNKTKHPDRSLLEWGIILFCCYFITMVWTMFIRGIISWLPTKLKTYILAFVFFASFAFCLFYWTKVRKIRNIEKYTNEMDENRAVIDKQFEKYSEILNIIPRDYHSPEAIKIMSRLAESGRALTMQEALNLTEEEFHRRKVERASREQLDKLDEINERIDDLYYYTWYN